MLATHVCVNHKRLCWTGVGVLKGLLYAVGGHDGPLVRKSCEVYDPATNTWKQVADMNMCRRNAGELVRSLLNSTVCHSASWHTHKKNSSCDGCDGWIKFICVSGVCAVNNLLYVIGGDDGSCNLASVEFYNPNTDKWTLLPTCMSTGRSYAGQRKRLCSKWQTTTFSLFPPEKKTKNVF